MPESTASVVSAIKDDADHRAVWLILMASVAYLVGVGIVFRAR